jgi:hypothetical protein
MTTPLRALLALISSRIDEIESIYDKHGTSYPSIDEPFKPIPQSVEKATLEHTAIAIAAAGQLMASLRSPVATVMETAQSVRSIHP